MKTDYDAVVVGAGPAGVTAAIYLERAEVKCCIIEREMPGGQVNKTSVVENYPGFPSISGPELAEKFMEQLNENKIKQIYSEVQEIENHKGYKTLKLSNGKEITTKKIILAVGRSAKKFNNKHNDELEGRGISYCSLCDGHLYKNEDVAIVGAGNSALEESLYLADICKSVTIISRSDQLKGDKSLRDQVTAKANIKVLTHSKIKDFAEKDGVLEHLIIESNDKEKTLKVKACFIFIGYEPATKFLESLEILDEKGYIIVDEKKETRISGIYAAGDVVKKEAFQIVTATGEAALAAVACIKSLKEV